MHKSLYLSLAIQNLKKNYRTVIPYLCTCIITIMMFSILDMLRTSALVLNGIGSGTMGFILLLGRIVIGAFSVLFIFYTNSFLIKKRMKEFGVYNVLGLEKKHIVLIIIYETIILSLTSLILGLFLGVAFSKVSQLFLYKLMGLAASNDFTISISSIILTIFVFSGIFFLVLLGTIRTIFKSNPIELIRQESAGEKEPKANWILALVGFITLGCGYALSQSIADPVMAILLFFVAVILVIIGTFCLFIAGSIVILKMLKKNKKFYYQTKNFTAVSGLIYRMKRNAAGLANICILSTCVMVIVSTTFSLYLNIGEILDARFKREIMVTANDAVSEEILIETDQLINSVLDSHQIIGKDVSNYRYYQFDFSIEGNKLVEFKNEGGFAVVMAMSLADYNRLAGKDTVLANDEILIIDSRYFKGDVLDLGDNDYKVTYVKDEKNQFETFEYYASLIHIIVVNDINNFINEHSNSYQEVNYLYMVDLNVDGDTESIIADEIRQQGKQDIYQARYMVDSKVQNSTVFSEMYGSLLFIGIFLSVLFLIATVLIIYYKQITEGYEDVRRFDIMKKVGMSQKEVSSSIRRQVLMVFFIPIIMATIHIGFAFKMISIMVGALSLNNTALFAFCTFITVLVFIIVYAIVYMLTSRTYNHIVNQK